MPRLLVSFLLLGVCFLLTPRPASAAPITIDTVPVGNAGNAPDQLWPSNNPDNLRFGGVGYEYRIGTTEVTNAQYAAFLNEKAKSDPLALYNTNMGSNARGGITRSGVNGSYTYAPKTNMADKPVNYVSWYDSIRFANWLNNGQGAGSTETGAYTIESATVLPINNSSITRNPGATWFLPSEDEWYKAAYHQPASQGGDADNYWLYATASNSAPTTATANAVGDISNPGTERANYLAGADWNAQNGNVTTVGSAGPLSDSFYGTADQDGNVWEWNEALILDYFEPDDLSFRVVRGGSFGDSANSLQSANRGIDYPWSESVNVGFRVATVPEPSAAVLAIVGCVLLWGLRKRFK